MTYEEKNYELANGLWVGTEYGDLRRERASLMKRLIHDGDETVKPRIRELTLAILEYIKAGTMSGRINAKNPPTSNYPKNRK